MLRLKTLGGWSADRGDGVPREIPAQRVALLALLVAAGPRGVSRDRAAALLWPDAPDEKARHSLGQSVYALRRDADSADVVVGTTALRLNPDVVSCDAWETDAAHRAGEFSRVAELYAGPFLDAIHVRGSAELEQTIDGERVRLSLVHADAIESLARAASHSGNAHDAARWWRRLAATDPYSSRVALELMRALVADGDRTAALTAARVHETLVREHLEVEPDRELTAFVDVLRSDVASAPRVPVDTPVSAPLSMPNVGPHATRVWGRRRIVWGVISTAACAAIIVGARRSVQPQARLDTKRVYIAWFENRTGNRALDPLGGMASDWVEQGIERSGVVTVASGRRAERVESSPRVPDAPVDANDAARRAADLGAGTLVSGAYYRVGERLRFHVRVSNVARGEVLDAFDAEGAEPFDAPQLEVLRQRTIGSLASLVDPRLSSWVRVASKPPSYEAYREFVTGQSHWGRDHREALRHFLRATELDSTFYAARVEAAILHRLLGECARTEAISAELRPVRERLAPYEYHALEGQLAQCQGDWQGAYAEARALTEMRPRSAFLEYSLALQAMQLGRYHEAKDLFEHHALEQGVAEVGPNFALTYAQLLSALGDARRGVEVARWLRVREPRYARGWVLEATLLARAGQTEQAERLVDTFMVRPVAPTSVVMNGMHRVAAALAATGDTAAGRRTLTRALAAVDAVPSRRADRSSRLDRAQLLYELGRHDDAQVAFAALAVTDSANVEVRGALGLLAAACHDTTAAAAADSWLASPRAPYTFTRTMYRARIAAALGHRAQAVTLLAAALDEGNRFQLAAVREYAEFASLRKDAEFNRLLTPQ